MIASAISYLGREPALRQNLIEQPHLIAGFVHDAIRYRTPAPFVARTVTKDMEFAGQSLGKGDRVLVLLASANFDDRAFSCPRTVEPDRKKNSHLAFGAGVHFCPGSALARMEIEMTIVELLRRHPDFRWFTGGDGRAGSRSAYDGREALKITLQ